MAITKEHKNELVAQYIDWAHQSKAMVVTEYLGLNMKQIDELRSKTREAGGEFHIIKNTLGRVAFTDAGLPVPEKLFEGSTAVAFAFQDAPALAKTLSEFARTNEFVKIKGGFLENRSLTAEDVKALAEMPPLPVMRAQLLGILLAPASKLVRTLAEPGRGIAAAIKAFADREGSGAEAAPAAAAAAEAPAAA